MSFPTYQPQKPKLIKRAKTMRRAMTDHERKLWRAIRDRLPGNPFRRQFVIGPYTVDFCSLALRLVVELDGNQHGTDEAQQYDAKRTAHIEEQGFRVLRFANHDVIRSLDSILDTIFAATKRTPTPGPSPQGGGEEHRAHG